MQELGPRVEEGICDTNEKTPDGDPRGQRATEEPYYLHFISNEPAADRDLEFFILRYEQLAAAGEVRHLGG